MKKFIFDRCASRFDTKFVILATMVFFNLLFLSNFTFAQSNSEVPFEKRHLIEEDKSLNFKLIEDIFYSLDAKTFNEKWVMERLFAQLNYRTQGKDPIQGGDWSLFDFHDTSFKGWDGDGSKSIYPDGKVRYSLRFMIREGVCVDAKYFFERINIPFVPRKVWVRSFSHGVGARKAYREVYTAYFARKDFDGKGKVGIKVYFDMLDDFDCLSDVFYEFGDK